jgi:uncharacterized membrane protein YkvA (DUF1232 family)
MSRRRRTAAMSAATAAAMSEGPLGFGQRVSSLPALVRDTLSGRYDGLGRGRLALVVVALVYIVSPVDVVPEALLTVPGLLDDAAVAAWVLATVMGATTAYRAWWPGRSSPADPGAVRFGPCRRHRPLRFAASEARTRAGPAGSRSCPCRRAGSCPAGSHPSSPRP